MELSSLTRLQEYSVKPIIHAQISCKGIKDTYSGLTHSRCDRQMQQAALRMSHMWEIVHSHSMAQTVL